MGFAATCGQYYAGSVPHGFLDVDDAESARAIRATLDSGLCVFDAAAIFGAGHSERLLGLTLKDHPDAMIISKLGSAFDEDTRQVLHDETSPQLVIPAIDRSLRRLNRDCVDVMLVHLNVCWLLAKSPQNVPVPRARTEKKVIENAGAIAIGPLRNAVMSEMETLMDRAAEPPTCASIKARSAMVGDCGEAEYHRPTILSRFRLPWSNSNLLALYFRNRR